MSALGKLERTGSRRNARRFTAGIAALFALACLLPPGSAFARGTRTRTPPSTPGDFHVTAVTETSVSFAWDASSPGSSGSIVYEIFNDTTGLILNVGNVTSYTWTEVESGGTYSFHIIAASASGSGASAPSPEVTVTILGTPLPTPVQPAAPVITQTSVTSDTITVSWTEATPADEIDDYAVLVNGMGQLGDGGGFANSTTFTATGLWPGFTYTITVVAYSLSGTTGALSTESHPVTVTTTPATITPPPNAPTAPTGLNGWGDGGGEAIISWNPSTSVNEPQADIQYNIYIDGVLDVPDTSVGDTTDVYIFPRGATVPAQVWVVAVDQFGNQSARSNVLTITGF
jgi:hypothetical protein